MGLVKLAVIGGLGYYAGKKFNEGHQGQANNAQHGGCHGWKRNRNWHEQPQPQLPEPSNPQDPGLKREMQSQGSADMYYYYNTNNNAENAVTEKPVMVPGYGYAQPPQDLKQAYDTKAQMSGANNDNIAPPSYGGYGRPMSPQQRMYPQEQWQLRRVESPEARVQLLEPAEVKRAQSVQPQSQAVQHGWWK